MKSNPDCQLKRKLYIVGFVVIFLLTVFAIITALKYIYVNMDDPKAQRLRRPEGKVNDDEGELSDDELSRDVVEDTLKKLHQLHLDKVTPFPTSL